MYSETFPIRHNWECQFHGGLAGFMDQRGVLQQCTVKPFQSATIGSVSFMGDYQGWRTNQVCTRYMYYNSFSEARADSQGWWIGEVSL